MPEELNNQVIERLVSALNESRGRTDASLDNLNRKLDQLQRDLVEAENRIRRDLQTQFITRNEYDPRHKVLEDKIAMFDRHLVDAEEQTRQLAISQVEIKQVRADLEELDNRVRGAWQRATPWIAIAISAVSVAATVLQHIQLR